MNMCICWCIN